MSEDYQHGYGDVLPVELRRMRQRLLEDGVAWRAEFPPSEAFCQSVEAFGRGSATPAMEPGVYRWGTEEDNSLTDVPVSAQPRSDTTGRARPRSLRGLVAVVATITVAALFALAFQMVSVNRPGQQTSGSTSTPAIGVWQAANGFQSRNGERVVVAPSDPRVVYRLNARTFAMERSGDSGKTWHEVALPSEVTQSPLKSYAVFDINPLDASIVYLTAFGDTSSANCPSPFVPGVQGNRNYTCSAQYVSTDDGARWQRLMLPSRGQLTGMLSQVLGAPRAPLLPQANRVYSLMTLDAVAGAYRLVASSDGVNWQLADAPLAATGLRIESYVPSPTGSTVWVTMSDGGLWRSDDAGTSWARAADLPQAQFPETAGLAAARTVDGHSMLYVVTYSPPLGDVAPTGVRVSVDGGKTWQPVPAAGIPDGQHAAPHSAMTRADGTLVLLFRTPELNIAFDEGILHDAAYYAWKPGATSWTRLTPIFDAEAVEQQWIAPSTGTGTPETIWALIYRDPMITYVDDAYVKDGTYTISSCGLEP